MAVLEVTEMNVGLACYFGLVAVVSSSDDKKLTADPDVTSSVLTVGEVTSSDATAIPAQPSAVSQDKVCILKSYL